LIFSYIKIRVELFQPETPVVVDAALANRIVVYQAVRTSRILFSRHIRLAAGKELLVG